MVFIKDILYISNSFLSTSEKRDFYIYKVIYINKQLIAA